ncbi:MAG: DUF4199 domain-containing protein [Bacteroidetes bacterium]|nr:DUF4199 domain-containing protein [Bacteroidota bacterium]
MEENVKAPFWKPALIYGAIVGFVSILLGVIFYVMNLYATSWIQWVSLVIGIAILAYVLVAYRNEHLGGFATYGQLFLMALVIGLVSSILLLIYTYLMHVVIDPDLADKIKLVAEEKMMNNPRIPENRVDGMIERLGKSFELKRMLITTFIGGVVANAIIGLILAAFIKKEETPVDVA